MPKVSTFSVFLPSARISSAVCADAIPHQKYDGHSRHNNAATILFMVPSPGGSHRLRTRAGYAARVHTITMNSTQPPNIVLILADNLGWGELGCYGGGMLRGAPT